MPQVAVIPRILIFEPSKTLRALDCTATKLGYTEVVKYRSHMMYITVVLKHIIPLAAFEHILRSRSLKHITFYIKINPVKTVFMYLQFKVKAKKCDYVNL